MNIPPTVLSQPLAGETVVLNLKTATYFGLDELGTRIWDLLRQGAPPHGIHQTLRREYDVDDQTLARDLERFFRTLTEHGLLIDAS